MAKWPPELASFETFLLGAGLALTKETEPDRAHFGNFMQEYSDARLTVRMGYDREWFVTLSPTSVSPGAEYAIDHLRQLLSGRQVDRFPLAEQIRFLQENWASINERFSSARCGETREQLDTIRREWAKRTFPGLFGALTMVTAEEMTWSHRNDSGQTVVVVLEPHGQEIDVPPGSQIVFKERGGVQPPSGGPSFEASREGQRITVWAQWPGGVVRVYLDGKEV